MTFASAVLFWLAPVALAIAGLALVVLALLAYGALISFRQWRCPHRNWHENMACDAVCDDCHKNLGFIGSWRQQLEKTE